MKRLLVQFDTDPHPAVFDRVVAIDAGCDHLFSYGGITTENVVSLCHGAMFTRGLQDLKSTAIFIGGSDAEAGVELLKRIQETFFGPMRVSVMVDSNGCNTTAAAAVQCAARHLPLGGAESVVLGGTGPVGFRAAQLLAVEGATVRLASRYIERAEAACARLRQLVDGAKVLPAETSDEGLAATLDGAQVIIAAGAAGVQFLTGDEWRSVESLKVLIDLNAVPPAGLQGVEPGDKATERDGIVCYGALGVGGLKMKIHKAAIEQLFSANDRVLDTVAIHRLASELA
ncbi:MAG: bifunctional NADP-dependent methylenetetrahydromethanopterin dehydrogenase/methylenetetrahydrofolate dehydrogenase [Planctomycetaceae bacterium]|nr:bifunctional NADP-dependent methylenetetrahydromethanopterin dehydrogenase/methylenetetrahydrofolate dehydrogenase [Planctomycetaceae bacterium]